MQALLSKYHISDSFSVFILQFYPSPGHEIMMSSKRDGFGTYIFFYYELRSFKQLQPMGNFLTDNRWRSVCFCKEIESGANLLQAVTMSYICQACTTRVEGQMERHITICGWPDRASQAPASHHWLRDSHSRHRWRLFYTCTVRAIYIYWGQPKRIEPHFERKIP